MSSNHFTVIVLLFSGLFFISLAVWKALTIVVSPPTIEVVAPLLITANKSDATSGDGSHPGSVTSLLSVAQDSKQSAESRNEAVIQLASHRGTDPANGQQVFKRVCAACHEMHGEGADYAPDLSDVTKRLTREKIVESIVNPNAVVEEKYKTTVVVTLDGDVITGLLTEKTDEAVTIFDGKVIREIDLEDIDEMATKNLSSMPERQTDTMTADEFLSLIEYLCSS